MAQLALIYYNWFGINKIQILKVKEDQFLTEKKIINKLGYWSQIAESPDLFFVLE